MADDFLLGNVPVVAKKIRGSESTTATGAKTTSNLFTKKDIETISKVNKSNEVSTLSKILFSV